MKPKKRYLGSVFFRSGGALAASILQKANHKKIKVNPGCRDRSLAPQGCLNEAGMMIALLTKKGGM